MVERKVALVLVASKEVVLFVIYQEFLGQRVGYTCDLHVTCM